MISESAAAKVNLTLNILGKRPDNYHKLHSYVFFAPDVTDIIHFEPKDSGGLSLSGAPAIDPTHNSIIRAAQAMCQRHAKILHGHFTLEKNIPIAAGLGGGTADAAATIRLLHRHWQCTTPLTSLTTWSAALGADVPVCLHSRWSLMEGIGEQVTPLATAPHMAMQARHTLLITPPISVPTASIFQALTSQHHSPANSNSNDLQAIACTQHPKISDLLAWLEQQSGCLLARMSGSGATCFGLFASKTDAQTAALKASTQLPNHWYGVSHIA